MKPPAQSDSPSSGHTAPTSDSKPSDKKRIALVHHTGGSNINKKASSDVAPGIKTKRQSEFSSLVTSLSDRELEVFSLLGRARTTRQIAAELCLSVKTIETHISRIKVKLGIESFNEMIVSAALWTDNQKG